MANELALKMKLCPNKFPKRYKHEMKIYKNDDGFQVYCSACNLYEKTKRTEKEAIEAWNRK